MSAAVEISGQTGGRCVATTLVDRCLFVAAITMPFLPKIGLGPGIYANVFDLLIIAAIPAFLYYDRYFLTFPAQRLILVTWLLMAILTGGYVVAGQSSIIEFLKILKRIIYIPLIYIGYKAYDEKKLALVVRVGYASILWNFFVFMVLIWKYQFDFGLYWRPELIFGGLINRYINISTGTLEIIPAAGSHGIWGTFCILVVVFVFCAWRRGRIGGSEFLIGLLLPLIAVALTPSRETILLAVIFFAFIFFKSVDFRKLGLGRDARLAAAIVFLSIAAGFTLLGNFAIFEKLKYTADAVEDAGTENNVGSRIIIWRDSLATMIHHPLFFIGGVGVYSPAFTAGVDSLPSGAEERRGLSVGTGFESAPGEALAWGGIWAFGAMLAFGFHLWRLTGERPDHPLFMYFRGFLIGIFVTNTFSGAAIFADALYAWFLLTLGFLYRIAHES